MSDSAVLDDPVKRCPLFRTVEWTFESAHEYSDPFGQILLDGLITDPEGCVHRVPGFWAGGRTWRIRFSPERVGRCTLRTVCSDDRNTGLHNRQGALEATDAEGDHPLWRHGPLRLSADGAFLMHHDGLPFLWLADTWWLALTERLPWPEGLSTLTADRVAKGFSVIELLVGLFCDMPAHDERGINEGGHAWSPGFTRINPTFYDRADVRMQGLIEAGLVPCLFGSWSFHLLWMGVEKMKQHWRYLVARYGAYPVVWCLSGGGTMPYYVSEDRTGDQARMRHGWSQIAHYLASVDPYHRPILWQSLVRGIPAAELKDGAPYDLCDYALWGVARDLLDPGKHPGADPVPDLGGKVGSAGMMIAERHAVHRPLF